MFFFSPRICLCYVIIEIHVSCHLNASFPVPVLLDQYWISSRLITMTIFQIKIVKSVLREIMASRSLIYLSQVGTNFGRNIL